MSTNSVVITSEDGITRITINRPEKLNALNADVIDGLKNAFAQCRDDRSCRVVVLTGAGDKAFVAGADITELQNLNPEAAYTFVRKGTNLMSCIENLGKPVIAAVNGYALGGGCELALSCTIRIASENAMLGLPEVKLGLMPGYGGTQRLSRLIGRGRALALILTGDPVDAAQALSWGLLSQVVAADELKSNVDRLAAKLARSAPIAMAGILNAVNRGADLPFEAGIEIETEQFAEICASEDMREGTNAFLEKRKPEFRGR